PFHAGSRLRSHRVREISQLAQALDLRRLERDPAQHHRQGRAWSVGKDTKEGRMDIKLREEQELLRSSVQRLLRDQYDFDARRKILASEDGFSCKQWEGFAELGLLGAPFSEEVGGLGG